MLEILKKSQLFNQRGMTIAGVLASVAIIGIGIFAISGGMQAVLKTKSTMGAQINLSQFRGRIITSLGTGEGVGKTVAANPVMSCLQSLTDCSSYKNADTPIRVMTAEGVQLTDPSNPSFGFSPSGQTCTQFNATNGNDSCPFRFEVRWRPVCPPVGGCTTPQNKFSGVLTFSGQKLSAPNAARFNFQFFPARMDSTLAQHCTTVGGVFDPGSRTCQLPMEGVCPDQQIVVRLDGNNQKFCAPIFYGVCPSGSAISEIDASGNLTCKAITFCPAGTSFGTWDPWIPSPGDFGIVTGGDGCDGTDGCDGGS